YGPLIAGGVLPRPPADEPFFIVDFDEAGRLAQIHENKYILAEIYGTELTVSEDWAPTTLVGVSFRSTCYGVELNGPFGIAVVVHVQLNGLYVGKATLYTWGTVTGDRIDGQFGYVLDFTNGIVEGILTTGGDQYPIYALRN